MVAYTHKVDSNYADAADMTLLRKYELKREKTLAWNVSLCLLFFVYLWEPMKGLEKPTLI